MVLFFSAGFPLVFPHTRFCWCSQFFTFLFFIKFVNFSHIDELFSNKIELLFTSVNFFSNSWTFSNFMNLWTFSKKFVNFFLANSWKRIHFCELPSFFVELFFPNLILFYCGVIVIDIVLNLIIFHTSLVAASLELHLRSSRILPSPSLARSFRLRACTQASKATRSATVSHAFPQGCLKAPSPNCNNKIHFCFF